MNFYGVTIQLKPLWQNLFDSAIYFFDFNSLLFARELREGNRYCYVTTYSVWI